MSILNLAEKVDLILGIVFALAAFYMLITQNYFIAFALALSSALSFAFVKFRPGRWLIKRLLLRKLKL